MEKNSKPHPDFIPNNATMTAYNKNNPPASGVPQNEALLIPHYYRLRTTQAALVPGTKYHHPNAQNTLKPFKGMGNQPTVDGRSSVLLTSTKKRDSTSMVEPAIERKTTIEFDKESQIAWSDEESVHTEWSDAANAWSDEDDEGVK